MRTPPEAISLLARAEVVAVGGRLRVLHAAQEGIEALLIGSIEDNGQRQTIISGIGLRNFSGVGQRSRHFIVLEACRGR